MRTRPFQFSLRTLLIAVTLLCGWLGGQAKIVQARTEVLEWMKRQPAAIVYPVTRGWVADGLVPSWIVGLDDDRLVWYRRLLGDRFVAEITYSGKNADDLERVKMTFPEAKITSN